MRIGVIVALSRPRPSALSADVLKDGLLLRLGQLFELLELAHQP
jgi:hypothetical protein